MITSFQIKAARALLGIDQKQLADESGLSLPTIQRMEAANGRVKGTVDSMIKVINALEMLGATLIADGEVSHGMGNGVRLKQPQQSHES
jgi:predicted transcriptional regulator